MKTFLLLFLSMLSLTVNAQKKAYKTYALMPDKSLQSILVLATENGAAEFKKVALDNIWNIDPIYLKKRNLPSGEHYFSQSDDQYFTDVKDVYRFLANNICETCNIQKTISKNMKILFYAQDGGEKFVINVFWYQLQQSWCISILKLPLINNKIAYKDTVTLFYK